MKHTPATPLPWEAIEATNATHAIRGDDGGAVASMFIRKTDADDAAYIAHACNAYPKLVKALHDARLRYADMRHRLGGEVAPSFERADESHASLLREIGEDA